MDEGPNRFHRVLQWLRIEDASDGSLSLSFAAFVLVAYLLISGKAVDLTQLGAFLGVLASLSHKRQLAHNLDVVSQEIEKARIEAEPTDTTATTNTNVNVVEEKK